MKQDTIENIDRICTHFQLGNYSSHSAVERGGTNYLWHLYTSTGEYAIKQLLSSNKTSELCEVAASQFKAHGINAISSILGPDGKHILEIEGHKFLVHPWIQGEIIHDADATEAHITEIAKVISKMCNSNLQIDGLPLSYTSLSNPELMGMVTKRKEEITSDIEKAIELSAPFAFTLHEKKEELFHIYEAALRATNDLNATLVLCHPDLNAGNIIWNGLELNLIDWEGLKPNNPDVALMKAAYMWCMNNMTALPQLLDAYQDAGGKINLSNAYKAFDILEGSELKWMMYNVKRYCDHNTPIENQERCANTIKDVLGNLEGPLPRMKQCFIEYAAQHDMSFCL